jgi:D-aspartate ligase
MRPPFVIKPSNSTEYWRHPFEKMRKTYFAYTLSEAREIAKMIFESGYGGKVILQEFFGNSFASGADASVLTTYSDTSGRVIRAVLGDVLLEDRSPTATGNYSAIVTRELDGISHSLINLLEAIGYTGIANFDILRQGSKRVCLELNARQGRSFDYVRMAGVNLARLLVGDMNGEERKRKLEYSDGVWSSVPWRTVRAFASNKELLERAEVLRRGGLLFSPYRHKHKEGISREAFVAVHLYREARKFKREIRGAKSVAE